MPINLATGMSAHAKKHTLSEVKARQSSRNPSPTTSARSVTPPTNLRRKSTDKPRHPVENGGASQHATGRTEVVKSSASTLEPSGLTRQTSSQVASNTHPASAATNRIQQHLNEPKNVNVSSTTYNTSFSSVDESMETSLNVQGMHHQHPQYGSRAASSAAVFSGAVTPANPPAKQVNKITKAEYNNMRMQIVTLKVQSDKFAEENAALKQKVKAQHNELESAIEKHKKMKQRVLDAEAEVERVKRESDKIGAQAGKTIATLKKDAASLQDEVHMLKGKLEQQTATVAVASHRSILAPTDDEKRSEPAPEEKRAKSVPVTITNDMELMRKVAAFQEELEVSQRENQQLRSQVEESTNRCTMLATRLVGTMRDRQLDDTQELGFCLRVVEEERETVRGIFRMLSAVVDDPIRQAAMKHRNSGLGNTASAPPGDFTEELANFHRLASIAAEELSFTKNESNTFSEATNIVVAYIDEVGLGLEKAARLTFDFNQRRKERLDRAARKGSAMRARSEGTTSTIGIGDSPMMKTQGGRAGGAPMTMMNASVLTDDFIEPTSPSPRRKMMAPRPSTLKEDLERNGDEDMLHDQHNSAHNVGDELPSGRRTSGKKMPTSPSLNADQKSQRKKRAAVLAEKHDGVVESDYEGDHFQYESDIEEDEDYDGNTDSLDEACDITRGCIQALREAKERAAPFLPRDDTSSSRSASIQTSNSQKGKKDDMHHLIKSASEQVSLLSGRISREVQAHRSSIDVYRDRLSHLETEHGALLLALPGSVDLLKAKLTEALTSNNGPRPGGASPHYTSSTSALAIAGPQSKSLRETNNSRLYEDSQADDSTMLGHGSSRHIGATTGTPAAIATPVSMNRGHGNTRSGGSLPIGHQSTIFPPSSNDTSMSDAALGLVHHQDQHHSRPSLHRSSGLVSPFD